MKEGQYYMTPLYLVCLPLIFLTLMPGIELDLFYSLVPITGVALLLAGLIMGNYDVALRFFLPVLVPTLVYAAVALRWAVDQFQREDVLFREAERFQLCWPGSGTCFATASRCPPAARRFSCFALILTSSWFLMQYLARQRGRRLACCARGRRPIVISDSAGDHGDLARPHGPRSTLAAGMARSTRYLVAGGRAGPGA